MLGRLLSRGGVLAAIGFIVLAVIGQANAAPITQDYNFSTLKNTSIDIDLAPFVSGDWETIEIAMSPIGTVVLSGSIASYTPPPGLTGNDRFGFIAKDSDGIGSNFSSIYIEIMELDAPVAHDASFTVPTDGTTTLDLSPYIDLNGRTQALVLYVQHPSKGATTNGYSSVTYTPNVGATGTDIIRYYVMDVDFVPSNPATITIELLPSITAPVVSDVSIPMGYGQASVTRSLSEFVTGPFDSATIVSAPANGSALISGGLLTYTPNDGEVGSDSFTWKASNKGVESNIATFSIEIFPPSVAVVPETHYKAIGDNISFPITAYGGIAPYSYALIGGTLPSGLMLDGDTVHVTPDTAGTFKFTVEATDINGFSGTGDFTIIVNNVYPPTINSSDFISNREGLPVVHDLAAFILDDFDTIEIVQGPLHGTASIAGTVLTYVPSITDPSADEILWKVTKGGVDSNTASIGIFMPFAAITLPPMTLEGKVGEPFSQVFKATDGSGLYEYKIFDGTLPSGLHFDGDTISGTPDTAGVFTFIIAAFDTTTGASGGQTYTITVVPADLDPIVAPITKDASVNVDFNAETAIDINLAALTSGDFDAFQIVAQPSKGILFENGMFISYTPTKNATGTDTFTWTATGPGGVSNTSTVTVLISAAPVVLPVAIDHKVILSPNESGSIELTTGATGAPFLRATIMGTVPADVGKFSLSGTMLSFTPHVAFDGIAKIGYALENASGISNTAEVRFIVAPRSDPTKDPEVIGLLTAQAEAAKKMADDQITTISSRLDSLHNEVLCNRQSTMDIRLEYASGDVHPDDNSKDGVTLSGKTAADCNWAIWTGGYVSLADYNNDDVNFSSTSVGLTAGIDYRFTPSFVGGVAVGYGSEESSIGSKGTMSAAQAMSAALYASWHPKGGVFVDAIIGYQRLSYDSTRYVTQNGQLANGKRTGNQVFGSLTAGYEFRKDGFIIAPYVGVRGSHAILSEFSETGGGIHGLTYGEQAVTSISGVVGVKAEYDIIRPWGVLTPSIRAEYRHAFVGDSDVSVGYTDTGTKPYRAEIKGRGKDSVTVSVGVKAKVNKGWSIEGTLSTTLGNGKPSYRVGVQATYVFCGLFIPQSACGPQMVQEPVKGKAAKVVKTGKSKKNR